MAKKKPQAKPKKAKATAAPSAQVTRCKYDEMVPIEKIKPHPENPNAHSTEQIAVFAEILRYQGTRRPFRVSKRSGLLMAGHGQLAAYKLNGWKECPVEYQDYENEAQEYADLVADNALGAWAVIDVSTVSKAFESLKVKLAKDTNTDFLKDFNPALLGLEGFTLSPEGITFPIERSSREFTKDERAMEYMASQSRNVVLVYSLTEFTRIADLLGKVMAAEGLESFSDAVKFLLEKYAGNKGPKKKH